LLDTVHLLLEYLCNVNADVFVAGLGGASHATLIMGLSLVSGNVGGQTKRALASAAVFLGLF
jgi:hypothetical protein